MIKTIYLGLTVIVFQLCLASYPQEAIVVLPTSITFYILVAMIVRLKEFDKDLQKNPFRPKLLRQDSKDTNTFNANNNNNYTP